MRKQNTPLNQLQPAVNESLNAKLNQPILERNILDFPKIKSSIYESKNKLLQKINQGLSEQFWEEYHSLSNKRRLGKLKTNEYERLIELTNELETTNNQRLSLIIKLSSVQQTDIEKLIANLKTNISSIANKQFSKDTKKQILKKTFGLCEYCQSQEAYSFTQYYIEFITPRSKFGQEKIDNLVYACQGCSNARYKDTNGFDPITGNSVSLFNARKDIWNENFDWSDNFQYIVGLTSKGRATIQKLKLNRENLIKYRSILVSINKHPLFVF